MSEKAKKHKSIQYNVALHYVKRFGEMINDNFTAACAARAAFFILLSIVPLTTLLISVGTYLPFSQEDVMNVLMLGIPEDLYSYARDVIADLYGQSGTAVISISAIAMLLSVSNGIYALMDGFNSMYGVREKNNFVKARILSFIYAFLFIILFAIILSVYVFVSHYYRASIKGIFNVEELGPRLLLSLRYLWGWSLFYFFILMLYTVVPGDFGLVIDKDNREKLKVHVRYQVPGAAFSAVAWMVVTKALELYIRVFPNISFMYGSLAGIVLAMLWLYFCMYCLFVGAIINHLLSKGYLTRVRNVIK